MSKAFEYHVQDGTLWHDREIRFDTATEDLRPVSGEFEIDSLNSVEDFKGNSGEKGALSITNIRLVWVSHKNHRTNLSIGYNCIHSLNVRTAHSRISGHTQALYLIAKFSDNKFEFIFMSIIKSPRLFTTIQSVFSAYNSTKLYRDLKLRGAIMKNRQLLLLPDEEVYSRTDGVMNLFSDQGNLGTFCLTTVRMVWHADLASNFNVSIPFLQIRSISLSDSRFGLVLVIKTTKKSGDYVLGFRIDPEEKLRDVYKEIVTLHKIFRSRPNYGVKFAVQQAVPVEPEHRKVQRVEDTVKLIHEEDHFDVLSAYLAEGTKGGDRKPVFDRSLGLAVEELKPGFTLEQLWKG